MNTYSLNQQNAAGLETEKKKMKRIKSIGMKQLGGQALSDQLEEKKNLDQLKVFHRKYKMIDLMI